MDAPVIEGRECGDCNVCCVSLTVDDPELRKAQGYRCKNTLKDHRCAIYATRPGMCRDFNCGWRLLRWVKQELRPDLSGVLIRMQGVLSREERTHDIGVVFTLLHAGALKAEGLAETVAAAVAADLPVFLEVPGPPGYTSGKARINDALEGPVLAKDKAALLGILREARKRGAVGNHRPITFGRNA